jgi:hypothetical protein
VQGRLVEPKQGHTINLMSHLPILSGDHASKLCSGEQLNIPPILSPSQQGQQMTWCAGSKPQERFERAKSFFLTATPVSVEAHPCQNHQESAAGFV